MNEDEEAYDDYNGCNHPIDYTTDWDKKLMAEVREVQKRKRAGFRKAIKNIKKLEEAAANLCPSEDRLDPNSEIWKVIRIKIHILGEDNGSF